MPTPKIWKMGDYFYELPFFLDFIHFVNIITLHYLQKLPTLLIMLIVDVKSGRFMYQSREAGDEAKKCKSPAKNGRVRISVFVPVLRSLSSLCLKIL